MKPSQLLKPAEAAKELGVSPRSLYRLLAAGELSAVRAMTPAGPLRIRPEDLAAYIARRHAA